MKMAGLLLLLNPLGAGAFSIGGAGAVGRPGIGGPGVVGRPGIHPVAEFPHSQSVIGGRNYRAPLTMLENDRQGLPPDAESRLTRGIMDWMKEIEERKANAKRPAEQRYGNPFQSSILEAPLKWMGPYLALKISLPQFRDAGLDFVLDTAANTNTIAKEAVA